jgi:hypothetical protein
VGKSTLDHTYYSWGRDDPIQEMVVLDSDSQPDQTRSTSSLAGMVYSPFGILNHLVHYRCQEGTAWAVRFPEGSTAQQDMLSIPIVPSASRRCLQGMAFVDSPSFL